MVLCLSSVYGVLRPLFFPPKGQRNSKAQAISIQMSMRKRNLLVQLERAAQSRGRPTLEHHSSVVNAMVGCGCTREGAQAALSILDPTGINHDPSRPVMGYPSSDGTRSVRYSVKGGMTYENTSENAHNMLAVVFTPSQAIGTPQQTTVGEVGDATGDKATSRVVIATAGKSNTSNDLTQSLLTLYSCRSSNLVFNSSDSTCDVFNHVNTPALDFREYMPASRKSRLVSGYVKVEDLTPKLYQTGNITAWRKNAEFSKTSASIYRHDNGNTDLLYGLETMAPPPRDVDQALLLGGTQWDLKEGGLITLCPFGANEPSEPRGAFKCLHTNDRQGDAPGIDYPYGIIPSACYSATYPAALRVDQPPVFQDFQAFDLQGLYANGITENTVLRITWNLVFEVFPDPSDSTITLATPSQATDPMALRMVEDVFRSMPPGVPAHENGLGDWFKSVAGKVQELVVRYGPTVLNVASALDPELAPAAAAAAAAIRLANNKGPKKNKQKQAPRKKRK